MSTFVRSLVALGLALSLAACAPPPPPPQADLTPPPHKRLDAKTLVTTPNSDVLYAMNYVDLTKDGPLVFEAPAGLQPRRGQ